MRVKTEEFLRRLTEDNYVAAQNAAKDAGFEVKGGRADAGAGNYRVVLEPADPSKVDRDQRRGREESRTWRYVRMELLAIGRQPDLDHDSDSGTSARRQRHDSGAEHHRQSYQRARYYRAHAPNSRRSKFASDAFADARRSGSGARQGDSQGRITTRTGTRYRSTKPGARNNLSDRSKPRSNR